MTSRKFGAMHGAPADGGRALLFADYGPDGWDVARVSFDPATFTEAAQVPRRAVLLADSVVAQEQRLGAALGDEGEGTRASVAPRPYRGARTAFDFHSLVLAPTSDGVNQGIALESRNLLNTFGVSVGTLFNTNERKFSVDAGASWAATPVILDAGMRWGSRGSTYTDTAGRVVPYSWNERSVQVVARLPLTRLIGQRRQSLVASVGAGITEISDQPVRFRFDNNNGRFTPITWALAASHVRAAAMRDLFQTGASATAIYRHAPGGLGWRSDYTGHLAAVRGTAITPGLARNHAVVLDAGHEVQRPGNYRFSSELVFPRGYARRFHEDLTRVGASYHLPLLYPDLAFGPW
ncbi:MAG TPA: hypothetical protein VFV33_19670, partial [Gemmatimonadaceae bacterium]|nr:hypothetical protein [Gemmatimonadaceae bacterium]